MPCCRRYGRFGHGGLVEQEGLPERSDAPPPRVPAVITHGVVGLDQAPVTQLGPLPADVLNRGGVGQM